MASAPHFSAEWLEAYRRRVGNAPAGHGKRPASRRAPARAQEGPENAPGSAPRDPDAEPCPYAPDASRVPLRGWDGRQTETERRYNAEVLGGAGRFEPVTFRLLGGCRYTPDFMTIDDGVPTFHEVKGSYRLGSEGRAWTAFCSAAAQFPFFRWIWAARGGKRGAWSVKRRVEPSEGALLTDPPTA